LAASAANRTLCDPVRSEPGKTRILGTDMKAEVRERSPEIGYQMLEVR